MSAEFWAAVSAIAACVAAIAACVALLQTFFQRWFSVPRLSVEAGKIQLVSRNNAKSLIVPIVVRNQKGIRGSTAERVSVSIRQIEFDAATNVKLWTSNHKRSLVTWATTNSETAITIPRGVEEQVILFTVPEPKDSTGGAGFGTGTPSTKNILFVGDGSECPRSAGIWSVWFIVSAESTNSMQFKLAIDYQGTFPGDNDSNAIANVIKSVKLTEIN